MRRGGQTREWGGNLLPSHDSIRFKDFPFKTILSMISNRVSDHDLLSAALLYRMTNETLKCLFYIC